MKRQVEIIVCDICKSVYTLDADLINRLPAPVGSNISTYEIPIEGVDGCVKVYKEVNICSDWHCLYDIWGIVFKCLEPSSGRKFIEALQRKQEESEDK